MKTYKTIDSAISKANEILDRLKENAPTCPFSATIHLAQNHYCFHENTEKQQAKMIDRYVVHISTTGDGFQDAMPYAHEGFCVTLGKVQFAEYFVK